jgi:ABC-type sugar transport system substrate-binding protein
MAQRHRSFCTTIKNEFPSIELVDTFEAHADLKRCAEYVARTAKDLDGIYVTGNSAVPGVSRGILATGKDNIVVICHDLDEAIVENLKRGIVTASVVCSPFAQGHDAVVHLFNHLCAGWNPFQPRLMQNLKIVNSSNLDEYWDYDSSQPRLDTKFSDDEVFPIENENTSYEAKRILVLCEDWNASFKQMLIGVHSGASEIRALNCEVEIKVLNQMKNPEAEVIAEAKKTIEEELEDGLDGIAAFVGSDAMAALLNSYSEKGIAVTAFNSEPLSLRSMIDWLMISASQLNSFTGQYRE